jgi:hypothetical protein
VHIVRSQDQFFLSVPGMVAGSIPIILTNR